MFLVWAQHFEKNDACDKVRAALDKLPALKAAFDSFWEANRKVRKN